MTSESSTLSILLGGGGEEMPTLPSNRDRSSLLLAPGGHGHQNSSVVKSFMWNNENFLLRNMRKDRWVFTLLVTVWVVPSQ